MNALKNVIFGVGILIVIVTVVLLVVSVMTGIDITQNFQSGVASQNFTYTTSNSLDPIVGGVLSSNSYVLNDTYISCDGNNDYLLITPSSNDTISFWMNDTNPTAWLNIVNSLGTCYINGAELPCPATYPVYYNGTAYFLCKTDATTFWGGTIDKVDIFDGQLTSTEVEDLYNEGRL